MIFYLIPHSQYIHIIMKLCLFIFCVILLIRKEHIPNKVVYGKLPPITSKIKARRLSFAGHCLRTADQPVAHLVFWTPTGGCSSRGRQRITYPDTIKNDIELEEQEIIKLMKDRKLWAQHVAAASSTPSTDD